MSATSRSLVPATATAAACLSLCLGPVAAAAGGGKPCITHLAIEPSPDPDGADATFLRDVVVIAPDDIWAVGHARSCVDCGSNAQTRSLAMHFDGTAWSVVPTPTPLNPTGDAITFVWAVDALGPDAVYAAGHANDATILSPDTFLMRWNGSNWERVETPGVSAFGAQGFILEAVRAIDEENVWVGGQFPGPVAGITDPVPVMIRYDGSTFDIQILPRDPSVIASHRVRAIDDLGPDAIWVAGAAGGSGQAIGRSYVARFDGGSWERVPTPQLGFGEILWAVAAIAPDDVWVTGRYQAAPPKGGPVVSIPLFLHWDGSGWSVHDGPLIVRDLVVRGPDDIYGVGGAGVVHWDGDTWSLVAEVGEVPGGGSPGLAAIAATGDCSFVAIGSTAIASDEISSLVVRLDGDAAPGRAADLDGDGTVGAGDLLALLSAWGPCSDCPADLDGDGVVGADDLLTMLVAWG